MSTNSGIRNKILSVITLFIWIRASLPRYRWSINDFNMASLFTLACAFFYIYLMVKLGILYCDDSLQNQDSQSQKNEQNEDSTSQKNNRKPTQSQILDRKLINGYTFMVSFTAINDWTIKNDTLQVFAMCIFFLYLGTAIYDYEFSDEIQAEKQAEKQAENQSDYIDI